ncbi:hypothetical protein EJ07DRAFT_158325 [Lizonia empirigonia]|nr:hypothetical protein EJ07DRAFT_158325 [Lizonia empirigonia]
MSGLINAISKAIPYVKIQETEDHGPWVAESDPGYLGEDEGRKKELRQPNDTLRSMRKPNSDVGLRKRTSEEESTAESAEVTFSLSPLTTSSAPLRSPRLTGHRSSSSPQIKTDSRSKAPTCPCSGTIRHQTVVTKLSDLSRTISSGSGLHIHENSVSGPAKDEEARTTFERSSSLRRNSESDLRKACGLSSNPDIHKLLKTCLQQKAKSASTTPPNGCATGTTSLPENQKLRRAKTVDFEDARSKSASSRMRNPSRAREHPRSRSGRILKQIPSCPGTAELTRCSPAGPAVTRTDVHVIAIAPTWSKFAARDPSQPKDEEADPATPTMQTVESSNGIYEVIWDDVPEEQNASVRRHSSSAQALEVIGSTATKGLERVNTKLTEWSGTWNTPSDSFKPTIVVSPDDNGCGPQSECAVVNEGMEIFAPPNSERVSAVHSRHPSRPVSAPMSRAASRDGLSVTGISPDNISVNPNVMKEHTLIVPDPDAWSTHLAAARQNLGAPSSERKLSNIDEADMKFRNHRDSVTIAHSRLICSGGVRPELFAHRDSVSIAKKRMHAQNYASSVRKHAHRPESQSESGNTQSDCTSGNPPLPIVKAHAAEALKKGTPASILRSPASSTPQHVRIEE